MNEANPGLGDVQSEQEPPPLELVVPPVAAIPPVALVPPVAATPPVSLRVPPDAAVPPVFARVPPVLTVEEPPVAKVPPVAFVPLVDAAEEPPVARAPPVCTTGEPPVFSVTAPVPPDCVTCPIPPVCATADLPPETLLVCCAPPVAPCSCDELLPAPPTPSLVVAAPFALQPGVTCKPNIMVARIHGFVIEEFIGRLTSKRGPPKLGGRAKPVWCCISGWGPSNWLT